MFFNGEDTRSKAVVELASKLSQAEKEANLRGKYPEFNFRPKDEVGLQIKLIESIAQIAGISPAQLYESDRVEITKKVDQQKLFDFFIQEIQRIFSEIAVNKLADYSRLQMALMLGLNPNFNSAEIIPIRNFEVPGSLWNKVYHISISGSCLAAYALLYNNPQFKNKIGSSDRIDLLKLLMNYQVNFANKVTRYKEGGDSQPKETFSYHDDGLYKITLRQQDTSLASLELRQQLEQMLIEYNDELSLLNLIKRANGDCSKVNRLPTRDGLTFKINKDTREIRFNNGEIYKLPEYAPILEQKQAQSFTK